MNYLKFNEIPQTKVQLKKAILKGEIQLVEINYDIPNAKYCICDTESVLNLWSGFRYAPKYYNPESEACASLGMSFYYKFIAAK